MFQLGKESNGETGMVQEERRRIQEKWPQFPQSDKNGVGEMYAGCVTVLVI